MIEQLIDTRHANLAYAHTAVNSSVPSYEQLRAIVQERVSVPAGRKTSPVETIRHIIGTLAGRRSKLA